MNLHCKSYKSSTSIILRVHKRAKANFNAMLNFSRCKLQDHTVCNRFSVKAFWTLLLDRFTFFLLRNPLLSVCYLILHWQLAPIASVKWVRRMIAESDILLMRDSDLSRKDNLVSCLPYVLMLHESLWLSLTKACPQNIKINGSLTVVRHIVLSITQWLLQYTFYRS
jgi:hypothetical protein